MLRGDQYDLTRDRIFLIYTAGSGDRCNDTPAADRREIRRGITALPFYQIKLTAQKYSYFKKVENPVTLGDYLKNRRLALGQQQKDVALLLKISEKTVQNWEQNRSTPSLHHIPKVIKFLGYDPYNTKEGLGGKIIRARRALGITQKELARKLGVDPTTLGRWERGEKKPTMGFCEKLKVLLVSLNPSALTTG